MNKIKKLNGSWQAFLAVTAVMVLAGTLVLLAAEKQEHGFLGVSVQSLDSAEREKLGVKNGVEVIAVEKDGAAAKAGIKENDVIQLLNGEKIRNAQDLVDIIAELAPEKAVKIGLWRDGKGLEVTAVLAKNKDPKHFVLNRKHLSRLIRSSAYLGIVLQELNPDLAPYFNVKNGEGVLIVRVEKNTAAEKAGLKAGDVIVQLGEKPVKDADAVHEVLADLKKGEAIAITVIRHGKKEMLKAEPDFNRQKRIIRIFRGGKDMDNEHLEINDLDIEIPEMDIDLPPLPAMPCIEAAMQRVHEKLDRVSNLKQINLVKKQDNLLSKLLILRSRVKVKIRKHLEKVSENFWI